MSQNPLPKSITATSSVIVASGPHDDTLKNKADSLHYELRRVGASTRNKTVTYELTVFDDDELLDKKIMKTKDYGDAVTWAIDEFIRVVIRDRNSP